ncbi:hypothetical protein ACHQM5_023136 [Ranunculus cassubicifolius]
MLNNIFYIRTPHNTCSFTELACLWEKKIGKTLLKSYVPEEQVLKEIRERGIFRRVLCCQLNTQYQANFDIEPSFGREASQLYPDVKYTTVDEYLNQFL